MRLVASSWILSLSALVVAACAAAAMADDARESQPQIAGCRIGFDGQYKVGHWTPLWVDVADAKVDEPLQLEVTTLDNDGVEVTTPHQVATGQPSTLLYIYVGRLSAPIRVALLTADGRPLDREELRSGRPNGALPPCTALPATSELVVHFGAADIGLEGAIASQDAGEGVFARHVARIRDADALPLDWLGYDGVDVLVITSGDATAVRRLTADDRRFTAVQRWVELGGKLVIGCGQNSVELLAADSPLARLVPARLAELVRLPQTRNLETFAANATAIGSGPVPVTIAVPRLTDVRGRVALFGQGDDLPLVVRAAEGFGEVTIVGLDLDLAPIADWSGRGEFLRSVFQPLLGRTDVGRRAQTLASSGYDDLAGALRQRLGHSFVGVAVITFPIVAVAIIAYLLLLGPLDFLFVHQFVRRPFVGWITFPALVLLASGVAVWWARAAKEPGGPRLNALELVDFDHASGQVRGTCWASLYSPRAERYDLAIDPRMPDDAAVDGAASQLASWGLPGAGLGGMHASGLGFDVAQIGYRSSAALDELEGVPILTAATKSLVARWERAPSESTALLWDAELTTDDDGLVVGTLTNQTGILLRDACLLHGKWGYMLGDVRPGDRVELSSQRTPNLTKTIVLRRARRGVSTRGIDPNREIFLADRASLDELLNVMMFYEAAGGYDLVGLPNRFQSYCDLSRLLDLDRAVLVADGTNSGSRWVDPTANQSAVGGEEQDTAHVVYRFVFPVDDGPRTTENGQSP